MTWQDNPTLVGVGLHFLTNHKPPIRTPLPLGPHRPWQLQQQQQKRKASKPTTKSLQVSCSCCLLPAKEPVVFSLGFFFYCIQPFQVFKVTILLFPINNRKLSNYIFVFIQWMQFGAISTNYKCNNFISWIWKYWFFTFLHLVLLRVHSSTFHIEA